MLIRILASIILIISILFLPLWVSVVFALIFMIYFAFFIEAVFLFLLSDLLFGVKEIKLFDITFISFVIALACLIILELIKKRLRFNDI